MCGSWRLACSAAVILMLTSCDQGRAKEEATAQCSMDADRFFPSYEAAQVDSLRNKYMVGCMDTKGYNFTFESKDCDSKRPLFNQPACYAPKTWLQELLQWQSARREGGTSKEPTR